MSTITCILGTLRNASFRGVPFWVKNDKEEVGRRIATHEYPRKDDPYNEDMGRAARKYNIHGYVVGDDAEAQKDALLAACEAYGGSTLCMPAKDPFQAVCKTATAQRTKDDQGIFEVDMSFVEDPLFGISPIDVPVYESQIGGLLSGAAPAVATVFATFSTDNVLPYVVSNAVARVQSFVSAMTDTVENIGDNDEDAVTSATTALIGMVQDVANLVQPGPNLSSDAIDLPTSLANVFNSIMSISNPALAADGMKTLASFAPLEPTDATGAASYGIATPFVGYQGAVITITSIDPKSTSVHAFTGSAVSPSAAQDLLNAAAFNGTVRCYALIAYAKSLAATVFTDRPSAIQARADLADLFQQQMERTLDYDLAILLQTARNLVITSITKQIATIVPVVTVECGVSLPSLYWAGRLYNDASRALELSTRNMVSTPAYMPQKFEALAS